MSSVAAHSALERSAALLQSVVGKKIVMAVTGFVLFGFITVHMIGNLQIFLGQERLDAYAHFLQENVELLWPARIVLGLSVILHVVAAWQLTMLNNFKARPQGYVKKAALASSYAARTMVWSGPIIAAFVVYHIMHFTLLTAQGGMVHGRVYDNVVLGFSVPAIAGFYMLANILLGTHLYHGVWSMLQTLGFNHPRYTPLVKGFAKAYGFLIAAGNCSIPLAVLTGILRSSRV